MVREDILYNQLKVVWQIALFQQLFNVMLSDMLEWLAVLLI